MEPELGKSQWRNSFIYLYQATWPIQNFSKKFIVKCLDDVGIEAVAWARKLYVLAVSIKQH